MKDIPTAFPWTHDNMTCTGMTLRDYFAAKAMEAMIAHPDSDAEVDASIYAKGAYVMADAMIKAREE